jgi:hypothetical protein
LTVRTDKDCQGTYEETIILSSKVFIYPNPVQNETLNIYLGSNEFDNVETALYNLNGKSVFKKKMQPDNGYINMNVSGLAKGVYLLNIKTERSLLNFKILKK